MDEAAVAAYFPLPHVLAQIMALYAELLGVVFTEATAADELWHPSVTLYRVTDAAAPDTELGWVALDLFPRAGKFGH